MGYKQDKIRFYVGGAENCSSDIARSIGLDGLTNGPHECTGLLILIEKRQRSQDRVAHFVASRDASLL